MMFEEPVASPIVIDIVRDSPLWRAMPEAGQVIRQAIAAAMVVARLRCQPCAELSVVLTDNAGIKRLNSQWRGEDTPTNILSFPAGSVDRVAFAPLLGDLVFAHETVITEAQNLGVAPSHHLSHLAIHGILHLFGYDHQNDSDAETMESLEIDILESLDISNPYEESNAIKAIG